MLLSTLGIPRKLYEEARKRGIDVEARIIKLLAKELNIDPLDKASFHLGLAEKYFSEAMDFLKKGDTIQASEKLYKVAEESIKAMANALGLPESREAREKGRWTLRLLAKAVAKLSERLGPRIYYDWDHAYLLHIEGFHESRLDLDQVKKRARYVRKILEIAKRVLGRNTTMQKS